MRNKKTPLILVLLFVVFFLLIMFGCYGLLTGRFYFPIDVTGSEPEDFVTLAKNRVPIGTNRVDALESLSDSWFHTRCQLTNEHPILDLFYYGSHDSERVEIILIESIESNGNQTVKFVGSLENYMLHLYDYCLPDPTSAFTNP